MGAWACRGLLGYINLLTQVFSHPLCPVLFRLHPNTQHSALTWSAPFASRAHEEQDRSIASPDHCSLLPPALWAAKLALASGNDADFCRFLYPEAGVTCQQATSHGVMHKGWWQRAAGLANPRGGGQSTPEVFPEEQQPPRRKRDRGIRNRVGR